MRFFPARKKNKNPTVADQSPRNKGILDSPQDRSSHPQLLVPPSAPQSQRVYEAREKSGVYCSLETLAMSEFFADI